MNYEETGTLRQLDMTAILTDRGVLAFGSVDDAFDQNVLRDFSITACINVADELSLCHRVDVLGHKVGLRDDDETEDFTRIVPQTLDIIRQHHQRGQAVMVHCWEGISRSACVVLAYLCMECNMELPKALLALTTANPKVDIYPRYLNQLRGLLNAAEPEAGKEARKGSKEGKQGRRR